MVNAIFVFTRSKFVQIHFFVPCFSDHFCEYSFKHERPQSVPSRSFSKLIYTFFSLLLQPNVDILCQNSSGSISPKTVTKELGSSIWNKETKNGAYTSQSHREIHLEFWDVQFRTAPSINRPVLDSKCLESRCGLIPRTACPLSSSPSSPPPPKKNIFPSKWFFFFTHI